LKPAFVSERLDFFDILFDTLYLNMITN
jgi:hypothetical protein